MLNRQLKAFGLPPIVGYILALLIFVGASVYLFYKTEYAPYIYAFFALSPLSLLSETKRNDFLKNCFVQKDYQVVRLVENGVVVLPFILFLATQQAFLIAAIILIIAALMARFHFNHQLNYTIPTPFYKQHLCFIACFFHNLFLLCPARQPILCLDIFGDFQSISLGENEDCFRL